MKLIKKRKDKRKGKSAVRQNRHCNMNDQKLWDQLAGKSGRMLIRRWKRMDRNHRETDDIREKYDKINAQNLRDEIEAQLKKAKPEYADDFTKNAQEYKENLKYLDKKSREKIGTIPEKSRVLVTAHDAFAYFGKEYGFVIILLFPPPPETNYVRSRGFIYI